MLVVSMMPLTFAFHVQHSADIPATVTHCSISLWTF